MNSEDFFNQHFSSYKSVPNETSRFEEWKKKVWKNQDCYPEYGPKEVVTLPSQCLAINKPNGCLNYVHFGIRNNSNTSINYSVTLKNLFLELVDNSEACWKLAALFGSDFSANSTRMLRLTTS
ncbi:hypothetical protein B9Z55_028516 [Caenorhabditis nigoni]|uniref:Uncharacterized protein n=1 Tax=Caenorhabditis nigoni TaxID=1611254 RepID=A0A2G5SB58_9PELO|nr:hypothetical protein B9Z55_028516 [Caenorhabditis nigoni]